MSRPDPIRALAAVVFLALAAATGPAMAAAPLSPAAAPAATASENPPTFAEVEIDGTPILRVMGAPGLSAEARAAKVKRNIERVAADPAFASERVAVVENEFGSAIAAGRATLMMVTDDDARTEGLNRKVLAELATARIRQTIDSWRGARTQAALVNGAQRALVATAVLILAIFLLAWLSRRLQPLLRQRTARVQSVGVQSFEFIRAERILQAVDRTAKTLRYVVLGVMLFTWLHYILSLFPWTRGTAARLLAYVTAPLTTLGLGLLHQVPHLIFLVVLFFLTRWVLKVLHLFFAAIGRAEVVLEGFDRDWTMPTYKIVRVAVIVFALVIAYPYIPGSSSAAFQGITIFMGVLLSLGSSSMIANMLAGYMLTYRRAFRIGDRVRIGDLVGDVTSLRLQVTHLRTLKHEELTVPNATLLSSEVINYSTYARTEGLILHTQVSIGYETPWRQVEAMLLQAASRTSGVLLQPPPFVHQLALGEFAITYEINVFCADALAMAALRSALHRNVLDVFNEFGVQIMTPAYEGDPAEPKVVPKGDWFAPPAGGMDPPAGKEE